MPDLDPSTLPLLPIGLAVAGALLALYAIGVYNRLIALSLRRGQAFSDIDVQLHQRYDLIPNLVEAAQRYAGHEKEVFENIALARAGVRQETGAGAGRMKAEGLLAGALSGLLAVAENYPDLKADAQFRALMEELSDIENKIAAARRFFNNATQEYNATLAQFPVNVVGALLGFAQEPFFEIGPGAEDRVREAPRIQF
jgi:LemA protein